MHWLRWIDDAKPAALVLAALLLTGATMSIGLAFNPSVLGRMLHHDVLYFHRGVGMGILPLLFFRIPKGAGWSEGIARLLIVLWLAFLALSTTLESTYALRIAIPVAVFGFAGLRIASVGRDSYEAVFDTICLVAVGIAFAGYWGWLLPIFVALFCIAKPFAKSADAGFGGLATAFIVCLAARALSSWVGAMWIVVLASGLTVCVLAWKRASTLPAWNRRISRLQVIVFAEALCVSSLLNSLTTDVFLHGTLVLSTMTHFFLLVPVLAWLQQREEPKGRLVWAAIGLATFGYHLFAWSHFMLGRRGMPWGYFAYDSRFSFDFRLAAIGAALVVAGAVVFAIWRATRQRFPVARVVSGD